MTSVVDEPRTARMPLYRKLKPGPGSSPDKVVANQRARLCGAMVELTAERGYGGVTVRELSRLAAVSTKTFYDCFTNIEDCFNVTYAQIAAHIVSRALNASGGGEDRLRALVSEAFAYLGEDPKVAQFVLVESVGVGAASSDQVRGATVALERLVNEEVARCGGAAPVPAPLIHGAVAAAMRVARTRILPARPGTDDELAARFSEWLRHVFDGELPGDPGTFPAEDREQATPSRPLSEIGDQRSFLLTAVLRLAAREGYASLTAPAIRREAGVSRRRFDQYFDDVEDCFLAAAEWRLSIATDRAMRRATREDTWDAAVVRTVVGLCEWLARNPAEARLVLVDITAIGRAGLERREALVGRWADRLRRTAPSAIRPDPLVAESSVAAAWCLAKRHLTAARDDQTNGLFSGLCFVLLAPVMGAHRAEIVISAALDPTASRYSPGDRRH
jgi:AcrR family transcriptional regulator